MDVPNHEDLFAGQLDRAIDDPVLAAGLSTLSDLSEDKRRQMLLANKHYGLLLLTYDIGATNRNELLGHLKVLSKSAVFAEYYWTTWRSGGSWVVGPESKASAD